MRALADNKIYVAPMRNIVLDRKKTTKIVFDGKENIIQKENAVYQYFLLFPQCFQKVSFLELNAELTS